MDVGSSIIGNLHRNSGCVHIRFGEVVDSMAALKNTYVNSKYYVFGLHEPIYDIALDVLSTSTLIGEFPQTSKIVPEIRPESFVYVMEEAIGLDAIEHVSMPSQIQLEDLECVSIHDLSLTRLK